MRQTDGKDVVAGLTSENETMLIHDVGNMMNINILEFLQTCLVMKAKFDNRIIADRTTAVADENIASGDNMNTAKGSQIDNEASITDNVEHNSTNAKSSKASDKSTDSQASDAHVVQRFKGY